MRNKYSGQCYRCKETVEPGDGHIQRLWGKWLTVHASCAIEHRGTDFGLTDEDIQRRAEYRQFQIRKGREATIRRKIQFAGETGKRATKARKWLKDQGLQHLIPNRRAAPEI